MTHTLPWIYWGKNIYQFFLRFNNLPKCGILEIIYYYNLEEPEFPTNMANTSGGTKIGKPARGSPSISTLARD